MKALNLSTLIIFSLFIQVCNQIFSMDITPEEWAQIQKLEAKEKVLLEREQQELQEAIRLSEKEERKQQAQER